MKTFVSLLRGINTSGRKTIPMADLANSLEELGFKDVRTYLRSGNVVFNAGDDDPAQYASSIRRRIAADFGHQVDVLVMHCSKMKQIAESNPLLSIGNVDVKWLHATIPFQTVSQADFDRLELPDRKGEKAIWGGKAVYLYCPNGYGRTKLSNSYFEKAFGFPATTRNWKTVLALKSLCESFKP